MTSCRFSTLSTVHPADQQSFKDKLFITFDIDWACDEVIEYTIGILEENDVPATWFITHDTPVLEKLRMNPKFEIGIHPNFNPLFKGNNLLNNSSELIIDNLMKIAPEATAVRSHSLTQSTELLGLFKNKGLTHDCNHFIPEQARMELSPWLLPNGLIKVPYFWEDDGAILYGDTTDISILAQRKGLKVFNFHPIHVFLNTERMERYEESRPYHRSPEELLRYRNNDTPGARTALKTLLGLD